MNKKSFTIFIFSLLIIPSISFSATRLYFEPQSLSAGVGGEFKVAININTSDSINALNAAIAIPSSFKYTGYSDGNSLLNIFVDKPSFDSEKQILSFSGLIPRGFTGSGKLLVLNFSPKYSSNNSVFKFDRTNTYALSNSEDPKKVSLILSDLLIPVDSNATNTLKKIDDKDLPEYFEPVVSFDSKIFEGLPFVVFNTVDKKSGINHYEVSISKSKSKYDWKEGVSPYVIKTEDVNKYIAVKAVDNDGNERIVFVNNNSTSDIWHSSYLIVIILVTLVLIVLAFYFSRKKRK